MRFLYLIFISLFFLSCGSVPKEYIKNNDICHFNDPIFKISKDEMTFDVEKYGKELKRGDLVLVDNKNFKSEYWNLMDGDITNKQTNKQLNIEKWIRYKNGKIKWLRFKYENGDSKIGREILYDENGKVEKIINHEKGYKICWVEAIEIIKKIAKKDIKKYDIRSFFLHRVDLNEFPNSKPKWIVLFEVPDSLDESDYDNEKHEQYRTYIVKNGTTQYVIDGITGKLLKTFITKTTP